MRCTRSSAVTFFFSGVFFFFLFAPADASSQTSQLGGEGFGKIDQSARCKQGTKRLARHVEIVADTDSKGFWWGGDNEGVREEGKRKEAEDDRVMEVRERT